MYKKLFLAIGKSILNSFRVTCFKRHCKRWKTEIAVKNIVQSPLKQAFTLSNIYYQHICLVHAVQKARKRRLSLMSCKVTLFTCYRSVCLRILHLTRTTLLEFKSRKNEREYEITICKRYRRPNVKYPYKKSLAQEVISSNGNIRR